MPRIFGHIEGYPPGSAFDSRAELAEAGLHPPTQAGISGSESEGADSVVLSGGFADDEDDGDIIIYTGGGGRDPSSGEQIADQELTRVNLALAINSIEGLPVRVIRGSRHRSPHSPSAGYRYEGLYQVEDYWEETGIHGYRVIRYRLVQTEAASSSASSSIATPSGNATPGRAVSQTVRVIRDTAVSKSVKRLHGHQCQVCGEALETSAGLYAEAAHIRPLGRPHNGPDVPSNVICLCPNHHVLFDKGGFAIGADLSLTGLVGTLRTIRGHDIDMDCVEYHRTHYHTLNH